MAGLVSNHKIKNIGELFTQAYHSCISILLLTQAVIDMARLWIRCIIYL